MQLYILFEKSNNRFIDFRALYWTETAARDGKHEDVMQLTVASFLVKNDPCVGLFAKKMDTTQLFYLPGELMRLKKGRFTFQNSLIKAVV